MKDLIQDGIDKHKQALEFLESNQKTIEEIASLFILTLEKNGKIIFMGNGGSAADAQHLAAELVGRFKQNRAPLAAIALSTNTSTITAIANDFGFEEIFSRQLESIAGKNDLVVGISTSGKSKNVIKATESAKNLNLKVVGFLGKNGGDLKSIVDIALTIPQLETPCIQEMHILAGHIICAIVEDHFMEK